MLTGIASAAAFSMVTKDASVKRSLLAYQRWLYPTQGDWRASEDYKPAPSRRRLWTIKDEATVKLSYPTKTPVRDIAARLGRSIGAVRAKARQLSVRRRPIGDCASMDVQQPEDTQVAGPDLFSVIISPLEHIKSLFQTRGSRISWSNAGIDMLAELWQRGFAASAIAQFVGTSAQAIHERARRAGLPARHGLPLIETLNGFDPLSYPVNSVIAGMIHPQKDKITGKRFFCHPRDKARIRFSEDTRKRLARAQDRDDDMSYSCVDGVGFH